MSSPQPSGVPPGEPSPGNGLVNCAAYANGRRLRDLAVKDISEFLEGEEGFVWVGLYEPPEELLWDMQEEFGLHDLAVEDAHSAHQRPKLEQYDNSLFVVLRTIQLVGEPVHIESGETHIFLGRRYVVTVRHGSVRSHVGLRTRCEAAPTELALGPGYVLYALMDFIVDQYFPIVEALEEELTRLEEQIFGNRHDRNTTQRIYQLKRDLITIKRAVAPLIDVCNRLTRAESDLIPEETRPYFRDIYDHLVRINEAVDSLRELVTAALEANLSLISVSQNEHTKRLAAWAAIIAVPTMIAGIYGMNFDYMPELNLHYGYLITLAAMALACAGLYVGFRRSKWL